ncbi:hypothetical protein TCAL_03001 [Tigriopus californicus]|uniref:Uncharacterized protein n=1 Tax=Tigriopus californicus TaxID=6832 RepID=A0A553PRY0_TIGCA|nr:hypothetical protein TCAL_03001 [Tigriopus californicus]
MAVAETFAEAARKASNGNWRKPRAKIYDYNQEFGGNYYQPMIQYVVERENYGPYHERRPVQMPERAEINSNKYTQMRHEDYRNTDLELEHFLTRAYKSQIKDINSSTAKAHRLIAHNSKDSTYKTGQQLLGYHVAADNDRYHYASELNIINQRDYMRREKEAQMEAMAELERQRRKQWVEEYLRYGPAMARVRMIHAAASKRRQPHAPLDNVDTPFDSMTLLRGAPPGRERVNHYATELGIIKKHQEDYNNKMRKHLSDVNTFGDYDYHYKFYNGATDKNYQFYRPDIISDTLAKI